MVCRDPKVILDAMVLRENTSEIMNVMGEAIADIVLREDRFAPKVAQVRAAEAHNIDLLDQFIAEMPMLSWQRPQAGLIGFCHIDLPIDADSFAKRLLDPPIAPLSCPETSTTTRNISVWAWAVGLRQVWMLAWQE
ncbi:MAG: hypothetical protein R3E79_53700 [Caldilineaceae bacterium]